MLAHVRDRLSYANVVATLALFVALGGSSYAALSITSKDVRNRSLKGGDLKKNTITGTEVNESKLRTVPRARAATNAATADLSKSAGTATLAGSATTAAVADTARDAQALAGQGVGAFERSSRIAFGRAAQSPAGASGEATLLQWPELGVRLETVAANGGCPALLGIRFRNTRASGPPLRITEQDLSQSAAPGAAPVVCSAATNDFTGEVGDSTGLTLYFNCTGIEGEIRCLGTRSAP